MKKVLALVLALATVLSLGVVTFASDVEKDGTYKAAYLKDEWAKDLSGKAIESAPDKTYYYVLDDVELVAAKAAVGTEGQDGYVPAVEEVKAEAKDLINGDYFKFDLDKDDGSKYFKSVKTVDKLINGTRTPTIEVKLKDDYTDDEFKLTFTASFKSKSKFEKDKGLDNSYEITLPQQTIWMGNKKDDSDDITVSAGEGGKYYKPQKNEENEVLWEDENNTIATLSFTSDSDVAAYYPKLSTKWDNVKYAELFADQDAFVRQWVGTPSISSTSRAVLELNVPYIDDDDELTVDEDSILVYEETADGELVDITSKGTFGWNDDDEYVFTLKTRTLGTYIFAEAPIGEADADEDVVADDVVDADKVNPGTGF